MLKPNGTFRAVLPDIRYLCEEYLRQSETDPAAALKFIQETHMGVAEAPHGIAKIRSLFSRSFHYWMWDYPAMKLELQAAGFREIRRASLHDSAHAAFESVESPHRWENALGFEAIK